MKIGKNSFSLKAALPSLPLNQRHQRFEHGSRNDFESGNSISAAQIEIL